MSTQPPRRRPTSLLDGLADIAQDFWDALPSATPAQLSIEPDASVPQAESAAQPASANLAHPVEEAEKAVSFTPAALPFTDLWKVADEPINWTEVLASPFPTDGFTTPEQWTLYRQYAQPVLDGDTAAYLHVLKIVNPMADLSPYTASLSVTTRSSDIAAATFTVRSDLLASDGEHYLCGLSLRIARDLFATLPVTHVVVTAMDGEHTCREIDFPRSAMQGARFTFVDPVAFVHAL